VYVYVCTCVRVRGAKGVSFKENQERARERRGSLRFTITNEGEVREGRGGLHALEPCRQPDF
jgi:hypothetical protein